MLLAVAAKLRKKGDFQGQTQSRTERGSALLSMTSRSCLSYYDETAAVALKAISAGKEAPQQKWTADNIDDCTGDSYVAVTKILDAKQLWRNEHLNEMLETYEDMNGTSSDTIRSQNDGHMYSLDETWEQYEDMSEPTEKTA